MAQFGSARESTELKRVGEGGDTENREIRCSLSPSKLPPEAREERTIVGRGVRVGGRRMLRGENKDVTATSLSGGCKITVERKQNSKEGREGNK